MPFPKKNLNPGETVALDLHPHWWYFAEPAFALAGSIIVGIYTLTLDDGTVKDMLRWVTIALLVGTGVWLLYRALTWRSTNFVITSQRIIFRQGLVAKRGMEIPLDRVNNVNFSQGIFERMLGAGDLLIESGGEDGQQRFTDIRNPADVQNLIHAELETVRSRQTPGAFAAPSMSVPEQLERLEGLLQRGSITQEEFDAQKRKLFG